MYTLYITLESCPIYRNNGYVGINNAKQLVTNSCFTKHVPSANQSKIFLIG